MPLKPATCKGAEGHPCTADVNWITLDPGGKPLLIESEALPIEPRARLVLVNHDTGKGRVLTNAMVDEGHAKAWMAKFNMTLHRAHFANKKCPAVQERDGTLTPPEPEQTTLDLPRDQHPSFKEAARRWGLSD